VRAHGHIVSWNVNGQNKPGFNPYWTSELGPTAERPTDNTDEGLYYGLCVEIALTVQDGRTTGLQLSPVEVFLRPATFSHGTSTQGVRSLPIGTSGTGDTEVSRS